MARSDGGDPRESGPPDDVAGAIRDAMLRTLRGAGDAVLGGVEERLAGLDAYDALPPGEQRNARDFSRWLFRTFVSCLAGRRGLSPTEVSLLRGTGDRRARSGVPIAVLASVFDEAARECMSVLADAADLEAPDAPSRAAQLQLLVDAAALLPSTAWMLARGYIDGPAATSSGADPRARALAADRLPDGVPLHLLVACPVGGASPDLHALTRELTRRLDSVHLGGVHREPSAHAVGVVADASSEVVRDACAELGQQWPVVLVHAQPPTAALVQEQYLLIARHLGLVDAASRGRLVVPYADVIYTALLASAPDDIAAALVGEAIGPLALRDPAERAQTLELAASLLASSTRVVDIASELGVHRHTITRQIAAVQRATRRSLGDYGDALALRLAADLVRLRGRG